jgi:hypothetical protein
VPRVRWTKKGKKNMWRKGEMLMLRGAVVPGCTDYINIYNYIGGFINTPAHSDVAAP